MTDISGLARRVRENVSRVIVGKEDIVELLLCALVAGGHVLLEDVPGTGKTVMAKALARSLDCRFARIQFTPDLLPADVTGMSVYNMREGTFSFEPGPVFTHILLADEINRATPRAQAALLECMEERQVTEGGVTRPLERPFLVFATQNPIEIQGTFPLPEAQLDRFLMRLSPGYPSTAESLAMLERFLRHDPLEHLAPVAARADVLAAQAANACVRRRPRLYRGPVRAHARLRAGAAGRVAAGHARPFARVAGVGLRARARFCHARRC